MRNTYWKNKKTGNFYIVDGESKHSETLEDMIDYTCLYKNEISQRWTRPKELFLEKFEKSSALEAMKNK